MAAEERITQDLSSQVIPAGASKPRCILKKLATMSGRRLNARYA